MAEIRPFRGLRYDTTVAGDPASLTTPPYDVINDVAQIEFYRRNPHNIIRIELGQILPGDSIENNRYTRAASFLHAWLDRGILRRESEPAIYIYEHTFPLGGKTAKRLGFFAALRLEEWDKRIVRPHELTMAGPKQDRLQLMRATSVNCSPVFVLYSDRSRESRSALLAATSRPPQSSFAMEDEEHRLWVVSDPKLLAIMAKVTQGGPVYMADGHHRYETALYYRNERRVAAARFSGSEAWNFVLALMVDVDDPGLVVLPTHRLVNPRVSGSEVAANMARRCSMEIVSDSAQEGPATLMQRLGREPAGEHVFGVYGAIGGDTTNRYALLRLRRETSPPSNTVAGSMDVSLLRDTILRGACGLTEEDSEDVDRLTYTRDAEGAARSVLKGEHRLAFFLNPTPVRQVLAVADAGEVMPHKSTYFHPKPLTGLVLSALDEDLGSEH